MSVLRPALFLLWALGFSAWAAPPDSDWREYLQRDLDQMHALILEAHPGVLDEQNPAFKTWVEQGYREATAMVGTARDADEARAGLNYYAAGFRDNHITLYSDKVSSAVHWAGWFTSLRGNDFVVTQVASEWPVELPPVGAKVLACDGEDARTLLARDVAPFTDQRLELRAAWARLAGSLSHDRVSRRRPGRVLSQSCELQLPDGQHRHYAMHWQPGIPGRPPERSRPALALGVEELGEERYWVSLPTFMPYAEQARTLATMTQLLRRLDGARLVVLDMRGNGGGYARLGNWLLDALVGRRPPLQDEEPYWRVSPLALAAMQRWQVEFEKVQGKDSHGVRDTLIMQQELAAALAAGQPWLKGQKNPEADYGAGPRKPFRGRLLLLTDTDCASACLSFVRDALRIPGVVHAGQATNADTLYSSIADQSLSHGLGFTFPLRVLRKPAYPGNHAFVPAYAYAGDMADTQALKAWVLSGWQKGKFRPELLVADH